MTTEPATPATPPSPTTPPTTNEPAVPAGIAPPAAAPVEPPKPAEPAAPVAAHPPFAIADLKLPEGVTLSEKLSGDFVSLINDSALSPTERAQKLIDLQIAATREASENGAKEFTDLQAKWVNAIKTDTEFGGANFEPNTAIIAQVLDKYGDEDARAAFDSTGAGNNPAIFRMLVKMGKDLVMEGRPVSGAPPSASSMEALAASIYTKGK